MSFEIPRCPIHSGAFLDVWACTIYHKGMSAEPTMYDELNNDKEFKQSVSASSILVSEEKTQLRSVFEKNDSWVASEERPSYLL